MCDKRLKKNLREIVEGEGMKLLDIEHGGKHPKLVCGCADGRVIRTVVSGSASDHRALLNIRTQLRRLLRGAK